MAEKKSKPAPVEERHVVESFSLTLPDGAKVEVAAYAGEGTHAIGESHVDVVITVDGIPTYPSKVGAATFDVYFTEGPDETPVAQAMAVKTFTRLRRHLTA